MVAFIATSNLTPLQCQPLLVKKVIVVLRPKGRFHEKKVAVLLDFVQMSQKCHDNVLDQDNSEYNKNYTL